ncbi:MAG: hypothetical protein A3E01_09940 [Gammaproteobacteria bacterium RIFCSPHIGHO2_12_FULL_63_22]|nr:MAG: hypothetical protein A3E01_09940 [Gammaproteobacteria bacterium RIFCSPHIGHO2_12_FULL_63_22]
MHIIGVVANPAPEAPPGVNVPDTDLAPGTLQIIYDSAHDIDLAMLAASGGTGTGPVYTLQDNGGATSVTILGGALKLGTALTIGTYVLVIRATRGTAPDDVFTDFQRVLTVLETPTPNTYPTPDIENDVNYAGNWDEATLTGTDALWTMASTDRPTLNGTFDNLNAVRQRITDFGGQVKLHMPAYESAQTIQIAGTDLLLIGQVDGNGKSTTLVAGIFGGVGRAWGQPNAKFWTKNVKAGPLSSIVEGDPEGTFTKERVIQTWSVADFTSITITGGGTTVTLGSNTFAGLGLQVGHQIDFQKISPANNSSGGTPKRVLIEAIVDNVATVTSGVLVDNPIDNVDAIMRRQDPNYTGWTRGPLAISGGSAVSWGPTAGPIEFIAVNMFARGSGAGADGCIETSNHAGVPFRYLTSVIKLYDCLVGYSGADERKHPVYSKDVRIESYRTGFVVPCAGGHAYKSEAYLDFSYGCFFVIDDGEEESITQRQPIAAGAFSLTLNGVDAGEDFLEDKIIKVSSNFNGVGGTVTVEGLTKLGVPVSSTRPLDNSNNSSNKFALMGVRMARVTAVYGNSPNGGTMWVGHGVGFIQESTAAIDGFDHGDWRFDRFAVLDPRAGGSIFKPNHPRMPYSQNPTKYPSECDNQGGLIPSHEDIVAVSNPSHSSLNNGGSLTTFAGKISRTGASPPSNASSSTFTVSGLVRAGKGISVTPTTGVNYTTRIRRSDYTIKEGVGQFTVAGNGSGTFVLNASDTVGNPGTGLGQWPVAFKLATDAWDSLLPNRRFYDPASVDEFGTPNYYWADTAKGCLNASGELSPETHWDNINNHLMSNGIIINGRTGNHNLIYSDGNIMRHDFTTGATGINTRMGLPPMNHPDDAPNANYGSAEIMSSAGSDHRACFGTDPAGFVSYSNRGANCDFPPTVANTILLRQVGYCKTGSGTMDEFAGTSDAGSLSDHQNWWPAYIGYIDNAGALQKIAIGATSGIPQRGYSTIVGNHTAGAEFITAVAVPAGTAAGDVLILQNRSGIGPHFIHGREAVHVAAITAVNVDGANTIRFTGAPLAYDVYKRAGFVVVHAAPCPAWMPPPEDYLTR